MQKSHKRARMGKTENKSIDRLNLGKPVEKHLFASLFHFMLLGNHLYLLGSDEFKGLLLLYKPH